MFCSHVRTKLTLINCLTDVEKRETQEQDGLILVALPLVVEGGSSGLHVLDI